jgi:hypothetical protein
LPCWWLPGWSARLPPLRPPSPPPRPLAIRAAAVPAEPAPGWSPAAAAKSRRTGWVELDLSEIQARRSPQAARFAAGGVVDLELFPGERHRFRGRLVEDGVGGAFDTSTSFSSPSQMYRGSFDWVDINFGGSTFYLRVRGCNSNACGSWSTSGLNDPNYCI